MDATELVQTWDAAWFIWSFALACLGVILLVTLFWRWLLFRNWGVRRKF